MKITEIAVRRPIFTTMMIATLVVLGTFSYMRLGLDLFPNVEFPFVTVQTTLRGAGAEEVESSVTKTIEEAVNTVSGIDELSSSSSEGISLGFVKFQLEKDVDVAAQDVRDKISAVQRQLPQGTDPPVVSKIDFGAIPVINIVVYGDMDLIPLTQIAKKRIKEHIETVNGVGSVSMVGSREREIHIIVNPLKMSALGLTIKQVKDAISQQNIEIPGGIVEQGEKEFVLRTMGRIRSVADFNDVVVAVKNGFPVKLADIGRVEDTGERETAASFFNGSPAVTLVVTKQSGTNTVEVIDQVKERIGELLPLLPKGVKTALVGDQSEFIKASVNTVKEHLLLGALFAALMVMVFLGDVRSTFISSLAIPTSLIATFMFMEAAGFTLNNMTLLGLTIAVGIVIDDAIVMLENIYRHMEEKRISPLKAAMEGSSEISFAVIAMSTTLLVIFVPLAYMSGIVGRFLRSYGLTIAFAVAVSTFVALTLTPMMCSVFLKVRSGSKTRLQLLTDRINDRIAGLYLKALDWALGHRKLMAGLSVLIMFSMVPLLMAIGKDFLPQDDTGQYQITVKAPEGTSLNLMKQIFSQIETEIRTIPYVVNTLYSIGSGTGDKRGSASAANEGYLIVELTDISERAVPMKKLMTVTREMLGKYSNLRVNVGAYGGFGGGSEHELEYVITGPSLEKLQEYSEAVAESLRQMPGTADVDTSFSYAKPEYRVEIDRKKAHDLGVKIDDIANSLRTLVGGEEDITKFKDDDDLYQVRLRADAAYRSGQEALRAISVQGSRGLVRLDNLARIQEGVGPTQIERYNRQRKVTVQANSDGAPLGAMIAEAGKSFRSLGAPPEYSAGPAGRSKELGKMLNSFLMAFLMALIFVYIVLASQFESFIHPLSIMIVLPLTIPFALISLFLSGQGLTIFSLMGMFMLFGIVKKNSILQVDYTNTLRASGLNRHEAIMQANKARLRPILMTTLTLIAGMIPTALGTGAGSGTRRSMALVIIGGQALSLLITLLMTPVSYSIFDDMEQWFKRKSGGKRHLKTQEN